MCRDLPVIITLSCSISLKISATRTSHSYANIADNKIKMHTKCSHNIKFVLEWFCSCFKSWYIILVMRCRWLTGSICFGRVNNVSLGFNNRRNHIQINCVFLSYLFRLIDKKLLSLSSWGLPQNCGFLSQDLQVVFSDPRCDPFDVAVACQEPASKTQTSKWGV